MLGCSLGWKGFESFDEEDPKAKVSQPVVINLSALPAATSDGGSKTTEIEMVKTPCGCWILA